jgi:hypothetical protein
MLPHSSVKYRQLLWLKRLCMLYILCIVWRYQFFPLLDIVVVVLVCVVVLELGHIVALQEVCCKLCPHSQSESGDEKKIPVSLPEIYPPSPSLYSVIFMNY